MFKKLQQLYQNLVMIFLILVDFFCDRINIGRAKNVLPLHKKTLYLSLEIRAVLVRR